MASGSYFLSRSSFAALALSILLVCSVASNYLLWQWGRTQALGIDRANSRLLRTQAELRVQVDHVKSLKAMLGSGVLNDAERAALGSIETGNPEFDAIASRFKRDMDLFAPEVQAQDRSYPTLVTYLDYLNRDDPDDLDVAPISEAQ